MPELKDPKKEEQENLPPFEFDEEPASKKDQALNALEDELDKEKDARKEERFVWFCIFIILIDIFTFQSMQTWSAPVVIGIIQVIFIVAMGRKWGMDHIWTITEKLIDKWDGKIK